MKHKLTKNQERVDAILNFPIRLIVSIIVLVIDIYEALFELGSLREAITWHKIFLFHPIKYRKDLDDLNQTGKIHYWGWPSKRKDFHID